MSLKTLVGKRQTFRRFGAEKVELWDFFVKKVELGPGEEIVMIIGGSEISQILQMTHDFDNYLIFFSKNWTIFEIIGIAKPTIGLILS